MHGLARVYKIGELKIKEPRDTKSLHMNDLFDYYMENKENIKPTTVDSLRYTRNRFENFKAGANVGDVTVTFLKKFERNEVEVGNSQATIDHHMRNLRTIINHFTYIDKVIPREFEYPFGRGQFTISSYFPSKQVLKESEIKSVIDLNEFKSDDYKFAREGAPVSFKWCKLCRPPEIAMEPDRR